MRTPRWQVGQNSSTLEASIGISLESRPPCGLRRFGFTCLYTRLTPSTTTLFFVGQHAQHLAGPAVLGVVAGDHFHHVVFANVHRHPPSDLANGVSTDRVERRSNDFGRQADDLGEAASRSSRATAPKMRVPRGFFSWSISTTALRSKRT